MNEMEFFSFLIGMNWYGADQRLLPIILLSQAAPSAFVPHLEVLVAEVQRLWDQGLIREGERVLLWEGESLGSFKLRVRVRVTLNNL